MILAPSVCVITLKIYQCLDSFQMLIGQNQPMVVLFHTLIGEDWPMASSVLNIDRRGDSGWAVLGG